MTSRRRIGTVERKQHAFLTLAQCVHNSNLLASCTFATSLIPGKWPWYPLKMWLDKAQNHSGSSGKEKCPIVSTDNQTASIQFTTLSYHNSSPLSISKSENTVVIVYLATTARNPHQSIPIHWLLQRHSQFTLTLPLEFL